MLQRPAAHARRLRSLPLEQLFELLQRRLPLPEPPPGLFRRRIFTLWRTFWLFLLQTLSPGQSCRETVHAARSGLADPAAADPISPNTAAYCQARARLPLALLESAMHGGAARLCGPVGPQGLWRERRVRVVDGASVRLPDTPQNQEAFPQPKGQKPGCGFPAMRLAVVFCLACGALVDCAADRLGVAERELWRRLWHVLAPGDVALGDRGFCSLAEFWALAQRGVGVRRVRRLGRRDWLVEWTKMKRPPNWFSAEQWAAVPRTLLVRQVSFAVPVKGFRTRRITVATTLLDCEAFPAEALAELYRRRWQAELFIRDIKSTLGMEMLSCKSPEMARKELIMHLIAYNLIRTLMLEAAQQTGRAAQRLSFKGSLDTLRQWIAPLAWCARSQRRSLMKQFLTALGCNALPFRPDRIEPRAIKQRPKNYQRLTAPRRHFREIQHRKKYRTIALS